MLMENRAAETRGARSVWVTVEDKTNWVPFLGLPGGKNGNSGKCLCMSWRSVASFAASCELR